MGRHKKESFYQLLQRRIREHGEAALEAALKSAKKPEPSKPQPKPEPSAEQTRNAENCKRYRKAHPEKVKEGIRRWHENFEKEHGMCYATWRYRKQHGLL